MRHVTLSHPARGLHCHTSNPTRPNSFTSFALCPENANLRDGAQERRPASGHGFCELMWEIVSNLGLRDSPVSCCQIAESLIEFRSVTKPRLTGSDPGHFRDLRKSQDRVAAELPSTPDHHLCLHISHAIHHNPSTFFAEKPLAQ